MDCFIDYIGLRYCTPIVPESGMYINDQVGVSIKKLDRVTDSERKTFVETWNRIQRRAALEIEARILNKFMSTAKSTSSEQTQFGYISDAVPLDLGVTYKGIYFFYYPSSYTILSIPYIDVYSSQAYEGSEFFVYDLVAGVQAKKITVNLIEGYNRISLDIEESQKARSPLRLFVGYDSSKISLLKSVPNYYYGYGDGGCVTNPYSYFGEVSVQDVEVNTPFLYGNIQSGQGSGISAYFNIECSLAAFICQQRQLFKYAWAKILVAEINREALNSDRTNVFTTLLADQAGSELDRAMSDFNMSIGDVLDNMQIPSDGICFECNEQVRALYGRP